MVVNLSLLVPCRATVLCTSRYLICLVGGGNRYATEVTVGGMRLGPATAYVPNINTSYMRCISTSVTLLVCAVRANGRVKDSGFQIVYRYGICRGIFFQSTLVLEITVPIGMFRVTAATRNCPLVITQ